jgi:flagellar export protein FliJ
MTAPFRLARVLRLREQMRRLRAHEVEQLAVRLAAARAEIARLAAERLRAGEHEAALARDGRLTPDALHVARRYAAALAAAEEAAARAGRELAQALDAARAELLRARQEEEKYVRLAAAHRERVLVDEARETERTLDEIAVDRFRRRRKEEGHAGG